MTTASRPILVPELPAHHAETRGDFVAVQLDNQSLSYAKLTDRAVVVAGLLQAMGAKPHDRVVWIGRTSLAYFELLLGATYVRACLTPINNRLAPPEVGFILEDSDATLVFVTPQYFATVETLVRAMTRPMVVVAVDGEHPGFESYAALMAAGRAGRREPTRPEDDIIQLYTSGTTGLPKGVRLTNANYGYLTQAVAKLPGFRFEANETALCVMPLFHVAGVNYSVCSLAAGSRLLLLPEFSPGDVIRLIETERVAHVFLVPAMILMMLQAPEIEGADLSSLKSVSYGASPISEAVLAEAQARFGCGFVQFYGMTETTGCGTTLQPDEHTGERMRSCGAAFPGIEVRIQNDDGHALPPGEIGEIAIKGPAIMTGYWKREEATRNTISADGWLRTGDAGYRNEAGFFFVHDRVKDMIVSGGENIYPAEVENAIHGCPGVADVAVIGIPSAKWGEEVKAIVVSKPGETPSPDAIMIWARERIAGFKAPKTITFIDALPRNASGKILRRELRKPYWEGHNRGVA